MPEAWKIIAPLVHRAEGETYKMKRIYSQNFLNLNQPHATQGSGHALPSFAPPLPSQQTAGVAQGWSCQGLS